MNRFNVIDLPIKGLKLIERQRLGDSRGYLSRIFCADELSKAGWSDSIAQINYTQTTKCGTVRGMHYQLAPHSEMKLVTCIKGKIWDVAVDLRRDSPTFMHWHAQVLSAENNHAMLIPEGFAHGFQSLTNDVELLYCHSSPYIIESEAALNARDPIMGINWPVEINEISSKDDAHPFIDKNFPGVLL